MNSQVPISSVAKIFNGKTPSKAQKRTTGHPVLKIKDVSEQGEFLGIFDSFVDNDFATKYLEKQICPGDILILNAAHNADYVGSKIYLIEETVIGSIATGEWLIIRPDPNTLDSNYLFFWLIGQKTRYILRQLVKGIHLYPRDVGRLKVTVLPLAEQRRIAAILDKADAIRRKRQEAIRLMDEFLRSAFLEIVGPPGASDYGKWPEYTIEGLALDKKNSMRTGPFGSDLRHSEFVDEGIAVLGIDNAVKNYFDWEERRFITPEKFEKLKRYKIFPGDVIITIMGTTGRSAVIPDDIPLAITTKHLAAITLNRKLAHPEFIAYAIHDHPEILHQIEKAQRGAIMNGLNLTLIKELRLRIPPLPIQEYFAAIVQKIRKTRDKLSEENEHPAGDLFTSLVQRAFRGELVPTVNGNSK